jgi:hypothetical protein
MEDRLLSLKFINKTPGLLSNSPEGTSGIIFLIAYFSPSNNGKPIQNNNFIGKNVNGSPKYQSNQVPGQKQRPNTAHPSNRNQHFQSEKIPGGRPSFPEAGGNEFQRHGVEDEEEFNTDDMKMNRMAFLESLNQYQEKRMVHTDSKRKSPNSMHDRSR